MKQVSLRDTFRKVSESVSTPVIVVPHYPLSPTASASSAMKTEEDPETKEEIIQMEYFFDVAVEP